jgi:hypothetical protein
VVASALPAFPQWAFADGVSLPDAGPAAASGVAVLARPGAEDAARALAKEVYARASLRPASLDEQRARVLVGGALPADASPAVKDLADERASVHGDDGASRALLRTIAAQLNVRLLVVVEAGRDVVSPPSARVFIAESGTFDAARYDADPAPAIGTIGVADAGAPDAEAPTSDGGMAPSAPVAAPPSPSPRWTGMVASLDRTYGIGGPETHAPALATSEVPPLRPAPPESHPFYTSPWFWGAVGAAAFGGVAVYFATRDNSTDTIHLELQVPK